MPIERLAFNSPAPPVATAAARRTFATAPAAPPRDWGYFGLVAFTAVLLLRPQDHIPALQVLHVAQICALVGIGPMLLHRFARRLPVFRINAETTALLVLGGTMLVTAPFSIWPGGVVHVFIDSFLKILVVFVLMMNTVTTTTRLQRLTDLIVFSVGCIAAMSVADYARGMNLVEGGRLAGPVGGIFGNPNDLALNMVTFLPAAIVIAMSRRRLGVTRVAAAVVALLMLATVVLTQSRSGALGAAAAVVALALLGRSARRGIGVVTVVVVLGAVPFLPTAFWSRMDTIVNGEGDRQFTGSREARKTVMQEGITAFLDNPLTGVGAGQFKNYDPAGRQAPWLETHNALIQVAAETGIVGLLAFVFLIWRAAAAALATRRLAAEYAAEHGRDAHDRESTVLTEHTVGMTAGLAGWFVCALFASVAYNWTFYYLLALVLAGRELAERRLRPPVADRARA